MDALYRLGEGTVGEVQATLTQKAHYSTLRAQLSVLEQKGHVLHHERDLRYVYVPAVPKEQAAIAALRHVLKTFFDDSIENLLASLLCELAARNEPHIGAGLMTTDTRYGPVDQIVTLSPDPDEEMENE